MPERGDGQLGFDFEELAREEARERLPEWSGAPLHFTMAYYPPRELDAAFGHWSFLNGSFDSIRRSHLWHRSPWKPEDDIEFEGHRIAIFSADLAPERGQEGPGGRLHLEAGQSPPGER